MRLVHLGAEDEVLESRAIWLCASCEACTTRCPMGIDIAARHGRPADAWPSSAGAPSADARGQQFNRCFLGSVRRHGRVFELGMMAAYKLRSGDLLRRRGQGAADAGEGQALAPAATAAAASGRCARSSGGPEEEERKP